MRTHPTALAVLLAGCCLLGAFARPVSAAPPAVPPQNAASRKEPPPFPPIGTAREKAQRLFDGIVHDDPRLATGFFFPREAFLLVKGIADPGGYWDRLFARYQRDIHALHASIPDLDRARFESLTLSHRRAWVTPRQEANRLPYWAARHNRLYYRVGGERRHLEVRVMITWGTDWYITHLSEFH